MPPAPTRSPRIAVRPTARRLATRAAASVLGGLLLALGAPVLPARAATPTPVTTLTVTGTTTTVTVARVTRRAQAAWITRMIEQRLTFLDGCQATVATRRHRTTYRAVVRTVCRSGPAAPEAAAAALHADRPWYRVAVRRDTLTGFSLAADLPAGDERAAADALARLPRPVFTSSDDLSLDWVGPPLDQGRLDAAVAAFAARLHVAPSAVDVAPLAG